MIVCDCLCVYLTDLSAVPGLNGGDGTNLFQLLQAQLWGQTLDSLQQFINDMMLWLGSLTGAAKHTKYNKFIFQENKHQTLFNGIKTHFVFNCGFFLVNKLVIFWLNSRIPLFCLILWAGLWHVVMT